MNMTCWSVDDFLSTSLGYEDMKGAWEETE